MTKCLCIALSDHNLVSFLDELDAVFEFECYLGLVISLDILLVKNIDSLHSLSNTSNVQNCLITGLYVSVVVQYLYLSIEVFHTECLVRVDAF